MIYSPFCEKLELSTPERTNFLTVVNSSGKIVRYFKCLVPDELTIRSNPYGIGLFATRAFVTGEILCSNRHELVEDNDEEYHLITQYGEFRLINDNYTHFIKVDDKRKLSSFDSFMNHSCDPNVYIVECEDSKYQLVANRDIAPDDELTCNYATFCYELFEDTIDPCRCDAPNCERAIRGFKHLALEEQIKLLPFADTYVKERFFTDFPCLKADHVLWGCTAQTLKKLADLRGHIVVVDYRLDCLDLYSEGYSDENKTIIFIEANELGQISKKVLRRKIPPCIQIKGGKYGLGLYARCRIEKGAQIYKSRLELLPHNLPHKNFLLQTDQGEFTINETHSVRVSGSERQSFTFDSFMNHSCEPNYIDIADLEDPRQYTAIALRTIEEGDEIVCNYNLFDYDCDGHPIAECLCGSKNCRGNPVGYKFLSPTEKQVISQLINDHLRGL